MQETAQRITCVITDLEVGGVPLHLLRLAEHAVRCGRQVAVISLAPMGPVGDRLREVGATVHSCNATGAADWRVFERLIGLISATRPDVLHSLLFHANQAARIACMLGGFPLSRLVCEIQTVEIERTWHLAVDRLMWRFGAVTVGNSPSVVEHLHRWARIPQERLVCIPGGVDVERIANATPLPREEFGCGPEETLIAWVGRLDPVKGVDLLIRAMAELKKTGPSVRCLLAGDGADREKLEALAAELGVSDRVLFLGRRDDIPRLLRTADLFVFPSRTEGMPNAVLEALAAGCPIVATDVPGCRDVIPAERGDGPDLGVLIPPESPKAIAEAVGISTTVAHVSGARAQSEARMEYARRHYSLTACLNRYLALYDGLVRPRV